MESHEEEVIKKEESRLAKEQRLRKVVYNAIVTLSECVVEATLQKMLNSLDRSSWMEVIEERYLGRMCGFPLCTNPVEVRNVQKYRIDLRNKKVFEQSAVINKFCSRSCFLRFIAVRSQLKTEPLWIRGDEEVKTFDLNAENVGQQQQDTCGVEFIDDQQLITSLEILKIGDTAESDNEDNSDEINIDEEKEDNADMESYNLCRPYLTVGSTVASTESVNEPTVRKIRDETVAKVEIEPEKKENKRLSESEKLARIRHKYIQNKFKRPPEIIEAKSFNPQLSDKVPKNLYEDFERTLLEWYGPETICYLQYRLHMNLSNGKDEVITETNSIIAQFYADDRFIKKKTVEDILPPIDNVDQVKQRISVLAELLKPSWRFLEKMLNINGFGQQLLEIISTFRLSATNIVFERKMCDLAVAVIFRLLAYCDRSLMKFYPSDCIVSFKFMKYLEQIGCDVMCYARILSIVMNKLE
ncbi:putative RNA polymerase II subunit [Dirofilaria immitis]